MCTIIDCDNCIIILSEFVYSVKYYGKISSAALLELYVCVYIQKIILLLCVILVTIRSPTIKPSTEYGVYQSVEIFIFLYRFTVTIAHSYGSEAYPLLLSCALLPVDPAEWSLLLLGYLDPFDLARVSYLVE